MAMTAPTPMMIPSIVSADLILLRPSARMATLRMAGKFIVFLVRSGRRQFLESSGGIPSIFHRHITPNTAIAKLHNSSGVARNVGLVRNQYDGEVTFPIQPLEYFHHLDGGPCVECTCRFIRQDDRGIVD